MFSSLELTMSASSTTIEEIWARITGYVLLRFQGGSKEGPARASLIYARPAVSNPTRITTSFTSSIWNMAVVFGNPVMMQLSVA